MRSVFWMLCLSLASVLVTSEASAGGDAVVVEANPTVLMRRHAKLDWREANEKRVVREGSFVRCPGPCRLRFADGSEVRLAEGGLVQTLAPRTTPLPGRVTRGRSATVAVREGEVELFNPPGAPPLRIETPGGTFAIVDGRAEVHAFAKRAGARIEAAQAYRAKGATFIRLTGDGTHTLVSGRYLHRPEVVAPVFRSGIEHRPVALATQGPRGVVGLAWKRQVAASLAEVRVMTVPPVPKKASPFAPEVEAPAPQLLKTVRGPGSDPQIHFPLPAGRYRVAVRLRDAEGFWSPWSASLPVAVVRASLPHGAQRPDPQTLVLPRGTALRFVDPPKLEVAQGERGFYHNPPKVEVDRADGKLRLRLPGHPETVSTFDLVPRGLVAEVKLAPIAPTWPQDSVEASVWLRDPSGKFDPEKTKTTTRVFLGGEEITVSWKGDGARRRATIQGRALSAPELLKVEVYDEYSRAIGRAYVEVIGSSESPPRRGKGPRRISRR